MYIIHIYTHIPIFIYIYKYTRYHIYIYMICIHIFNTYTHKYTMYHIYIYIHKHIRYQTMDTNHTCTLEFLTIIIIAPQSVTMKLYIPDMYRSDMHPCKYNSHVHLQIYHPKLSPNLS